MCWWRKMAGAVRSPARLRTGALLLLAALLVMALDHPRPALSLDNAVAHAQATAADAEALSCRTDAGETDRSVVDDRCCCLAGACAVSLPAAPVDVGIVLAATRLSMSLGKRNPSGPAYRHFKPPRLQSRA